MAVARFQIYRSSASGVTWRFLSANNRSLGQAVGGFPSVDACARAVAELRESLVNSTPALSRDTQLWSWRLRLGGTDLVVSSRRYHRRVQAQYACRSFLDLVGPAPVAAVEHF
ncbi:hypothetical protein ABZ816_29015 [Actinosynnema sp. NPDC047251]|uniref:DUF1508 domain-containing protein n=1 Tax=Saccharothrix espanaensis (strain ATCC 51144 / DSM 44229 / JCM 9112 / NBRC 15066 / NRRL 15764) TaxID=1179773 RepID=K0JW57_SACES|nr:hypothetical protein [Saccharothrix espanaensis]CCH28428.1 hypothetical protein BN6_11020 [Saccharothrix espanaensis DSM 44229]